MSLPNIFTNIAKALVASGVLILGFVGYQLWGTSILHSRAQNSLTSDFSALEANIVSSTSTTTPTTSPPSVPSSDGTLLISDISQRGSFEETTKFKLDQSVIDLLPKLYREKGKAIARIANREIGLNQIIVEGTEIDDLKKGPGHYATTPFPGQPGNVAIAGHRTTFGAPFAGLQKLKVGDKIFVTTIQGESIYRVIELGEDGEAFKIVAPNQRSELGYQDGNHLTLTSCHPRFSADKRIIVRAELEGEPFFPLPRSVDTNTIVSSSTSPSNVVGAEIGLGGDSSALIPVLIFSFVLLGLITGMIIWSKRWKKWSVYSISAVPIIFAVFFLYFYVNRLLPAF